MIFMYTMILKIAFVIVMGSLFTDSSSVVTDVSSFAGLGSKYFNLSSCYVPNNASLIPTVYIRNVNDLVNMAYYRKKYSAKKLVNFQLTAVDSTNSSGFFTPAYLLKSTLKLYSNMSCSYIQGMGYQSTSILVQFPDLTFAQNALTIYKVTNLIMVDVTVDRTNSSWWDPGYICSMATNYPTLVSNATLILSTTACKKFYSHNLNLNFPLTTNHAIKIIDVARVHISRIRTWGGIHLLGGGNVTVSSSFFNSLGPTVVLYGTATSNSHQNLYGLSSNIIIYNNTIQSLFASAIFDAVTGVWIHHNYMFDLGWSGLYLRRSLGGTVFEYNFVYNTTNVPGSAGGCAGIYTWGAGWSMYQHTFRNNWIFSTDKCWYLDGTTSHTLFENNICHVAYNELNNGRYNIFKNNLHLAFFAAKKSVSLGSINLSNMFLSNMTPLRWPDCANNVNLGATYEGAFYQSGMPWSGHVYPNGTVKVPYKPWDLVAFDRTPNLKWSNWCAPTTAGPKNTPCADKYTTYYNNGTAYPFPCELYPSNNRFGSTDYVGVTVVWNTTKQPNYGIGYGSGPCNITAKQTFGCPTPASGWDPYVYNAQQKIVNLNWFNTKWYNWQTYNKSDPYSLFGTYYPLNDPSFIFTPSTFSISPCSKLAYEVPTLLKINIKQIGLLPGSSTATATPSSSPTTRQIACPTKSPTFFPTRTPTRVPTNRPSVRPTGEPSAKPTPAPSRTPTTPPTKSPTAGPSSRPSAEPWAKPSSRPSSEPSSRPTSVPTQIPTARPTTEPTLRPTVRPSSEPSSRPTFPPTQIPTVRPSTNVPTRRPTVEPTSFPTRRPTVEPTSRPTNAPHPPTDTPTSRPTTEPTLFPTRRPTVVPTPFPTRRPTVVPSSFPTRRPTVEPTSRPTNAPHPPTDTPTSRPTTEPTLFPTRRPTVVPTPFPTRRPTVVPSSFPTRRPTVEPTSRPTNAPHPPTDTPTSRPTTEPTPFPTRRPTVVPTPFPTRRPTVMPTPFPTRRPTVEPTSFPTRRPTVVPTPFPTRRPTVEPTSRPTNAPHPPTDTPTSRPTTEPTLFPTRRPTVVPSSFPTRRPTVEPTSLPTRRPTVQPSFSPTKQPIILPTAVPSLPIPTKAPTYLPSFKPTVLPSNLK